MLSSAVTLALLGAVSMAAGAPSACKCPNSAKMQPCDMMATGTAVVTAKIQDAKPSATSVTFTATVQNVFKGKVAANSTITFSATPSTFACGVSQPLPGQELVLTLSGTGPFTIDDCGLNIGWASLTPELRRALLRNPTTAYDCAQSKSCALGKTTVVDGWEGNGIGDQSCNKCACVNGDLNCSGPPCNGTAAPPLQPKKVSVGTMQVSETTAKLLSNPKLQGAILQILTPQQRDKLPANIMGQIKAGKADPSLVLQILAMVPPAQLKDLTKPQTALPASTTAPAAVSSAAPTSLTAVPSASTAASVAVNPALVEALKNPQVLLFLSQNLPPTALASIPPDALRQLTTGTATPATLQTIAAFIPAELQQKILAMVSPKPSSSAPAPATTTTAAAPAPTTTTTAAAPASSSVAPVAPTGVNPPSGPVSSLPAAEVSEIAAELGEIAEQTFSTSIPVTVSVATGTNAAAPTATSAAPTATTTAAPALPALSEQQLAALSVPESQTTLTAMLPPETLSLIPAPIVTALKAGTATPDQIKAMVAALPPPVVQAMAGMIAAPASAPAPTTTTKPAVVESSSSVAGPSSTAQATTTASVVPKVALTPAQLQMLSQPKTQQTLMSLLPPALLATIPAEDQADLKAGTATPAELEELIAALPAEVVTNLVKFLDAIAAQPQPSAVQPSSVASAPAASTTASQAAAAPSIASPATAEPSSSVALPTLPPSEVAEIAKELGEIATETFSSSILSTSTASSVPVATATPATLTPEQYAMLADADTQVTLSELLPQEVVALLPAGSKDALAAGKATPEQVKAIVAALPTQVITQLAAFLKPTAPTTSAAPAPATSTAAPVPVAAPALTAEQMAALADADTQKTMAGLLPPTATQNVPAEIMAALKAGTLPTAQIPAFVAALPAQIVTQMAAMLKAPAPAAPVTSTVAAAPVASSSAPAPAPALSAEQMAALASADTQKTIASLLPATATQNVPAEIMTALKAGTLPATQLPAFVAALPAEIVTQMAAMLKAPAPAPVAPAPAPVTSATPVPVESQAAPVASSPAPALTAEQMAALADADTQKTIAGLLPPAATQNVPAEIMTALKAGALPAAQLPAFVAALPAEIVTQMGAMLKAPAPAAAPSPTTA